MIDKYTIPKNPIVSPPSKNDVRLPYSSGQGYNDTEHKTYVGPNYPPQASPQGAYIGSQSTSPNKDYP